MGLPEQPSRPFYEGLATTDKIISLLKDNQPDRISKRQLLERVGIFSHQFPQLVAREYMEQLEVYPQTANDYEFSTVLHLRGLGGELKPAQPKLTVSSLRQDPGVSFYYVAGRNRRAKVTMATVASEDLPEFANFDQLDLISNPGARNLFLLNILAVMEGILHPTRLRDGALVRIKNYPH